MNAIDVLRYTLESGDCGRCAAELEALDRLARLVEADSAVDAGRNAVEAACHGTAEEFQVAVERLDEWERLQKERLAAVLGEESGNG